MALSIAKMSGDNLLEFWSEETFDRILDSSLWDSKLGLMQTNPKYDGKGKKQAKCAKQVSRRTSSTSVILNNLNNVQKQIQGVSKTFSANLGPNTRKPENQHLKKKLALSALKCFSNTACPDFSVLNETSCKKNHSLPISQF